MNLLTAMVLCAMGAGTAGCSLSGKSPLRLERGRTEVVIAADAPAIVRYAADEATNLLAKVLGAPVPLVNRASDGSTPVYLGEGPWTKDAGLDVSGFARDEYAMRMFGSGVVLVGRDGGDPDPFPKPTRQFREFCWQSQVERASLFALYDFLERYAGARFYFPGELGTILPRTDRIVVTDAEFRSKPDFQVRRFGYRDGAIPKAILDEFGGDPVAVRRAEFNRLRMETKYFPCCHGLNKFEYLKRFGKTHPEYFALNAQGIRNTSGAGHIGQVCYSSPIAEVIYEDVKAYLTGQPSASRGIEPRWGSNCIGDVVDVMSQDGMFPCSCAACQRRYDFAHGPNYATEFIWSNTVAIANRLTREGVKGTITQMAYRPYRSVPKTVEIPDNVAVMVAETGPWTLADEKVFAAQTDEIRAWAEKLGRKVWTWNYTCKATSTGLNLPGLPSTTPRAIGEYYKRIAPYVFGAFTETSSVDRWLYNHLNYYVFSRVMWDKSSDVDAILGEYYRLMYGPAAPEMEEFFESLEEPWAKHVAGVFRDSSVGPKAAPPTDAEMYGEVYSPAVRARYRELFRAAEAKAAGDSLVLRRLKLMREEFLDPIDANAAEYEARKVRLAAFVVEGGKEMAPQALSFLDIGGKTKKPKIKDLKTTFRTWFEKGDLRIVVDCAEPYMDKRMNAPFKDEISVTADDCLEIYVNPSGDRRRCFNFVVSSEGLLADAKFTKVGSAIGAIAKDYGWNSGFTATVTKGADRWTADISIPRSVLKGISASEGRIPLNVCRSRQVDDGLKGGNYYIWGDFVKGFPDVQNFGTIRFKSKSDKETKGSTK